MKRSASESCLIIFSQTGILSAQFQEGMLPTCPFGLVAIKIGHCA